MKVDEIKAMANRLLAREDSQQINDSFRQGVATLLEGILHHTGNYRGFNYLEWMNGGYQRWMEDGQPDFPDKYRYLGNQTKVVFH